MYCSSDVSIYLLKVNIFGECFLQCSLHLSVDLVEGVLFTGGSQEPHWRHLVGHRPPRWRVVWRKQISLLKFMGKIYGWHAKLSGER